MIESVHSVGPPAADDPAAVTALVQRIFPAARSPAVERVAEGVSTRVYRIRQGEATYYLRVLPEVDATFAPEVQVHALLAERGVRVPEALYYSPLDEGVARSVMLTTEIPGDSIARRALDEATPAILRDAGRQLALVNSVAVHGFGWVRRDRPHVVALEAEHPSLRAFATEHLESDLAALAGTLLTEAECAATRGVIAAHPTWLDSEQAWLAHGDFDTTPIFAHEDCYSGLIDFGEIRGADRWYDLGHFQLYDGETAPIFLLDWLLEGYQAVTPLPAEYRERISFASLLIAVRTLARTLGKYPRWAPRHPGNAAIRRALAALRL